MISYPTCTPYSFPFPTILPIENFFNISQSIRAEMLVLPLPQTPISKPQPTNTLTDTNQPE